MSLVNRRGRSYSEQPRILAAAGALPCGGLASATGCRRIARLTSAGACPCLAACGPR